MRHRETLALALVAAALAAGCGEVNDRALLAAADSQALLESVDRIESACADNDVSGARAAADEAAAQINGLPRRVDDALQANLLEWVEHIEGRLERDCAAEEEATPEPTETATSRPRPRRRSRPRRPRRSRPRRPRRTPTATAAPTETPAGGDEGGVPAPEEDEGDG